MFSGHRTVSSAPSESQAVQAHSLPCRLWTRADKLHSKDEIAREMGKQPVWAQAVACELWR